MPLYEYLCESCGRTTEILQRLDEPPLAACPHCGGAVKKQFSAPAFQFKGSGWYVTDYARKGTSERSRSGAGEAAKGASEGSTSADSGAGGASDSGGSSPAPSDVKSDAKTEPKSAPKPGSERD